jgi:hypothetical protein
MLKTEIAEVLNKDGKVYEIAEKINYNQTLTSEEKEVSTLCDAWVKEVSEKGDPDKEIAAFIKKTINEEVYNAPDELLDGMFERGSVGEFDDYQVEKAPVNTLIAHEAAKGGNVDRSYIDFSVLRPTWKNRQVETDLSYVDMRRNGFKSVALLTTFANEALKNAMFYDIFGLVDTAIVGGDQAIAEAGALPTQTSMDKLSLYLNDRNPQGAVATTLSKYAQAIMRMEGYATYMSDAMKDEFNRYGLARFFDGVKVASISGAKKQGNGSLLIPDKKIFGTAGIIGTLDMKGEIHVYEDLDNQNEVLKIKVADFTYGYCITDISKVCKITMA